MRKIFVIIAILFIYSLIYSQGKIDGFGNIKWSSSINDVKSNVVGKIVFTDEKKVVISKDGDIEYLYGFFYKGAETEESDAPKAAVKVETPDSKTNEPAKANEPPKIVEPVKSKESEVKPADSKLFYVSVKFPYLTKDQVKKKIEEKYGPATGEDIKDNKGAIIWNSDSTTIIMWVDNYNKKPYCMKINYLSKEVIKQVNEYQRIIFNTREIEVLKRLSL